MKGGWPPDSPGAAPEAAGMGLQAALLEAYRTHVTWEFPARDELRTRAYLFTAAAIYCAMVALLTHVRGRARIAYMAGVIHSIAAGSYMLMVRGWRWCFGVYGAQGKSRLSRRAAAQTWHLHNPKRKYRATTWCP